MNRNPIRKTNNLEIGLNSYFYQSVFVKKVEPSTNLIIFQVDDYRQ